MNVKLKSANTKLAGNLHRWDFAQADNVYSVYGICPTITAHLQGQHGHQINILEEAENRTLLALWDEYNHAFLKPDLATTIQPRHQVPNHGMRLILMETSDEQNRQSDSNTNKEEATSNSV